MLSCDLVVASETATFGLPEVSIGVLATCAGLFRGPRALPPNVGREMILTGLPLDATRAYQLGLANRLVSPGTAVDAALALATQITTNAPVSVQASLEAANFVLGLHDERGWEATTRALTRLGESSDSSEGIAAFFEKRPPRWTGR